MVLDGEILDDYLCKREIYKDGNWYIFIISHDGEICHYHDIHHIICSNVFSCVDSFVNVQSAEIDQDVY